MVVKNMQKKDIQDRELKEKVNRRIMVEFDSEESRENFIKRYGKEPDAMTDEELKKIFMLDRVIAKKVLFFAAMMAIFCGAGMMFFFYFAAKYITEYLWIGALCVAACTLLVFGVWKSLRVLFGFFLLYRMNK